MASTGPPSGRHLLAGEGALIAAIPYPDAAAVPGLAEAYAEISAIGRPVIHLYQVMGHSPEALRAYIGLSRFVRDRSNLPPHVRELAILQTGVTLGCEYEAFYHVRIARELGIPEEKIQAVLLGGSASFDEAERAVIAYAREVGESRQASTDTLATLQRLLPLAQVSELAVTVGMYHMVAAILLPLQVEIDPQG